MLKGLKVYRVSQNLFDTVMHPSNGPLKVSLIILNYFDTKPLPVLEIQVIQLIVL